MLAFTHAIFGLALGYIAELPIVYLMLGALLPDMDLILNGAAPFTHRGIVHTPIAALTIALLFFLLTWRKGSSLALLIGYISHLFLDTFTPAGIMWLFPLEHTYSLYLFLASGSLGNILISALSIAAILYWVQKTRIQQVIVQWIQKYSER